MIVNPDPGYNPLWASQKNLTLKINMAGNLLQMGDSWPSNTPGVGNSFYTPMLVIMLIPS